MKKIAMSIFIAIIVFLLLHTHGINNQAAVQNSTCGYGSFSRDVDLLMDTVDHMQADIVGCNINLWARLNDQFTDIEGLRQFIDVAVTGLGCLENSYDTQITNEKGFRQIAVKGNSEEGCRVDIVCQSLKYRDHNYRLLEETYLVVDIYGDEGCRGLEKVIRGGYSGFSHFGVDPKASACVIGAYDGELSHRDRTDIVDGVLEKLGGEKIEGIKDNGLLSITGYTPSINTCLPVEGGRININIALRYNQWQGKTYMWLGLPVICIPY